MEGLEIKNTVELIGYYGSDISHSLSAWTSTSRELTQEKIDRIPKLLQTLVDNGHKTPFEKSSLHFLVNTEIASHIHILKHRVGNSVNAECLTGDSVITLIRCNGLRKIPIKELWNKWNNGRPHQPTELDKLYSQKRIRKLKIRVLDEETRLFTTSHIKDIFYKGVNPVYKIILENGQELKCTDNHAIYTNDGYKTINTGLSINDLVGCNGIAIEIEGKPWTFKNFFDGSENYTRVEFAKNKGIKYELCKKWGYIHNIKFKIDINQNFQKGQIPWNNNKKGYKLKITEKGLEGRRLNVAKNHSGHKSNFWRGGISTDRELTGTWASNISKYVHKKHNFICQRCKTDYSNNIKSLNVHHIIPVSIDKSKSRDFDNLTTVCRECHKKIHKTVKSEKEFAFSMLQQDEILNDINWVRQYRNVKKLSIHFQKIIAIDFIGNEETYDIEIEGDNKNYIANNIVVHNSARYKELKEDKYYLPEDWFDIRGKTDYRMDFGQFDAQDTWIENLRQYTELGNLLYHECLKDLEPILGRKRAKESARFFKTYNSQITADVMFNWSSFNHFLSLRMHPDAQVEIRDIAKQMLDLVKAIDGNPFEHTIKAFGLDKV